MNHANADMKIYHIPSETKAILFDIDSTLYTNAAYAYEQVDVQIRQFARISHITADEARRKINEYRENWAKNNGGAKTSLGNTLVSFGIPISQSIQWRETLLDPEKYLQKDEKLAATLAALSEQFKLLAVTNNPVLPARKTLGALGVAELIPVIIGLDTCGVSKPDPLPYLAAAKTAQTAAEHCLSVGDRYDIDLKIPLKLGMGAVHVSGVTDVYRLPELLLNSTAG